MAKTAYQKGHDAYGVVDPGQCPYQDNARREAWYNGYYDAMNKLRGKALNPISINK